MNSSLVIYPENHLIQQFLKIDPTTVQKEFSEQQAFEYFCLLRWPETQGSPVCPYCGEETQVVWDEKATRSKLGKLARCKTCKSRPFFSARRFTLIGNSTLNYQKMLTLIAISCSPHYVSYSEQALSDRFKLTTSLFKKYRAQFAQLPTLAGLGFQPPGAEHASRIKKGIARSKPKKTQPCLVNKRELEHALASMLSEDYLYERRSVVLEGLKTRLCPKLVLLKQFNPAYGRLGIQNRQTLRKIALTTCEKPQEPA